MEENSESMSPDSITMVNGEGSSTVAGPAPATIASPANTHASLNGVGGAPAVNGSARGGMLQPANFVNGSVGVAAGGMGNTGGAGAGAGINGAGSTLGNRTFVTKRTRLVGLPPPIYSPLGAASPSLTSNAPTFPSPSPSLDHSLSQSPSLSSSSSSTTTPLASPLHAFSNLPPSAVGPLISQSGYSSQPPTPTSGPAYVQQGHVQGQQGQGSNGAAGTTNAHLYPALHLHPLNDTFIPKQISLYPPGPHNRIKIGRQTNAKTVPAPNNGYFDSKVLSRMHGEVWCENSKIYIKDVKSSNGTFINGERLSPEAVESDVFELHNNDMIEFGIDITSEETKSIVHRKVAARCFLVMSAEDAVATSRNFANYYRDLGDSPLHRRAGIGGVKSLASSGMNLDQVLNRLQTELQKSRETGAELGTLTSTIGEIHETLGGNLPGPPIPAFRVPPYVAANSSALVMPQQQQSQQQTQILLQTLQSQLQETQDALNGHVERIRNLEGLLNEQERMKIELKEVREKMEEARGEWDRLKESRESSNSENGDEGSDKDDSEDFDTDDMKTIRLDGVLDGITYDDTHSFRGPQVRHEDFATGQAGIFSGNETSKVFNADQTRLESENTALSQRMDALTNELAVASQLSLSLKNQFSQAAVTIRGLEEKVNTLERARHNEDVPLSPRFDHSREWNGTSEYPFREDSIRHGKEDILREVESRLINWKKSFEDSVKKERRDWEEEREHLRVAIQEWEQKSSIFQQQQAISSGSGAVRKKRRSKASTVNTSSSEEKEETSEESEEGSYEGGFVSPVTDDSMASPDTGLKAAEDSERVARSIPKRPRSRRRRRAPHGSSARSAESSSPSGASRNGSASAPNKSDEQQGGIELRRRRSWIPFSNTNTHLAISEEDIVKGKSMSRSYKRDSSVFEHPAIPLASAAGVVVLGYLAYTAFLHHQK